MNMAAIEKLTGGDVELATTVVELAHAERSALRELTGLEQRLGEVRRALAVGDSISGVANAGTTFATLLLELGRRDVLVDRLTHAKIDLAAVRRASR